MRLQKLAAAVLFASLVTGQVARADNWAPEPPPALNPSCITIGPTAGGGYCASTGSTIVVVERAQVPLNATSEDFDTVTPASGASRLVRDASPPAPPGPTTVWTCSGGSLPQAEVRVASGTSVTWTAPAVPNGLTETTATVTVRADDGTVASPGRRPAGDTGERDDADGPGLTITFRVVKTCPATLTVAATCQLPQAAGQPYSTIWQNTNLRTWGWLVATMEVGGGTPPNPPNNWNGLVIREEVALHPTAALTTMAAADFTDGTAPAAVCTGSSLFVVGQAGNNSGAPACTMPASDNRYYDLHSSRGAPMASRAQAGVAGKTVTCQQKYFCNTTQLPATGTFRITRTWTAGTWTPPAPPNAPAQAVTEVVVAKQAE